MSVESKINLCLVLGFMLILTVIAFNIYFFYPLFKKYNYKKQANAYQIIVIVKNDTEGDKEYCPIYYFNISNVTYECKSNYESTKYPDTSKNLVYYNPLNPKDCLTQFDADKFLFNQIFNLLGSIIIIGVGISIIVRSVDCCYNSNKDHDCCDAEDENCHICHCYESLKNRYNVEEIPTEQKTGIQLRIDENYNVVFDI